MPGRSHLSLGRPTPLSAAPELYAAALERLLRGSLN